MLKELRAQHRTIIQMSFSGFKNNEIAEKMGMAPATISQILRSPLGQAYLNGLHDRAQENTLDVRKKLISLNRSALGTIERLLDPKVKAPHSVQLNAAKDVLDRNGYKPSDKFEIDVFSHKSDDEIEAEIRAMEAAVARNQFIQSQESQSAELPASSDSGPEDGYGCYDDSPEGYPFPSDESDSDHSQELQTISERPETSSAASSQYVSASTNPTTECESSSLRQLPPDPNQTTRCNSHNSCNSSSLLPADSNLSSPDSNCLPEDIVAKLEDETFDPFQNI